VQSGQVDPLKYVPVLLYFSPHFRQTSVGSARCETPSSIASNMLLTRVGFDSGMCGAVATEPPRTLERNFHIWHDLSRSRFLPIENRNVSAWTYRLVNATADKLMLSPRQSTAQLVEAAVLYARGDRSPFG